MYKVPQGSFKRLRKPSAIDLLVRSCDSDQNTSVVWVGANTLKINGTLRQKLKVPVSCSCNKVCCFLLRELPGCHLEPPSYWNAAKEAAVSAQTDCQKQQKRHHLD